MIVAGNPNPNIVAGTPKFSMVFPEPRGNDCVLYGAPRTDAQNSLTYCNCLAESGSACRFQRS